MEIGLDEMRCELLQPTLQEKRWTLPEGVKNCVDGSIGRNTFSFVHLVSSQSKNTKHVPHRYLHSLWQLFLSEYLGRS